MNMAKDIGISKRKILIIGDSHVKGCASRMSDSLDSRFNVCGIVKPGSCTDSICGSAKEEVDKLNEKDFIILSSGSNDIGKNDSRAAFRNIVNYVSNEEWCLLGCYAVWLL
jgi:hypothetical protein